MTTDARPLRMVRVISDAIAQCPNPRPRRCDSAHVWLVAQRWHATAHRTPCPEVTQ